MRVRFGTFEVDLEGRRLLKAGVPISLREQSFHVLAALIEHPGELVTREELRRRLWPDDTEVDIDVALNSAVSRLRDALGDSANAASVIETVPKRGYRFLAPIPRQPAVAVMPFANQTGDPKDEYFSDGLTDELIRAFSRIDGLRVAAPSLVFRFKGRTHDAKQVGRELGVEAVLEGSVWRSGERIRVTVNLVSAKDGFNLWAQRFDGDLKDLFGIQDEVCAAAAEALHLRFGTRASEGRPRNMTAYVQYLKGWHLMKRRRPQDVRRAFEYHQEAIRLEPGYVEPYYGAAMYYIVSANFGALPPRPALCEADELIAKGLALDATSVMLHAVKGMQRMYQWNWVEAEEAHRHALSLEPENAFPHMMYPILLSILGRHDAALVHAAKAVALDPLDLMTNYRLVQANYYARRYDEAIRAGRSAVELAPDSPYTFFYLALALAAKGLTREALSTARRGHDLNDGLPLGEGYFGYLLGTMDRTKDAHALIARLRARREKGYMPALPIAWTYLGLGEAESALEWLEMAFSDGEPNLGTMMVFPGYDGLRGHARFDSLTRALKLARD